MRPALLLSSLAAACLLPLAAAAQWQWIDAEGRRVFSDTPPPASVPAKNILRQPGGRRPPAEAAAAAAPTPAASAPRPAASLPRPSGKDPALEEKLKQAEAAKAESKKAEAEKIAKAKAENCARAKEGKATMDSGIRVVRTNDKGEREILDDQQRAAEVKRLEAIIASDCAAPGKTQ